jgi:predicted phage tail protein
MLRKVYLDGEMAQKFGPEFTIYAKSVGDVFENLSCNFPEMRKYLIDCHENDIGFLCQVGDEGLQEEKELLLSMGEGDVYISPQPAGSKSAIGKILAAVAIVALVAVGGAIIAGGGLTALGGGLGALQAGLAYAASTWAGLAVLGVAVNLALTGIQQLMAPDPSVDDFNNDRETSYLFRGSEQTILEGDPVPVLYGQLRIPARPIGFELRNKTNTYYNYNYNGGVRGYGLGATQTGSFNLVGR